MSLQVSDAVIWQETADGVSLYHTETGDFRTLNETGAKIWKLVDSDGEREHVICKLSHEYAGSNAAMCKQVRQDVEEFIAGLISEGMLAESMQT